MNASRAPEDPPRDWRDSVPEPQPGDSWWDNLGKPWYEEPEPRIEKPSARWSAKAKGVVQSFARPSRRPGGRLRSGQRSGERRLPPAGVPVQPGWVLDALRLRWRAKYQQPCWGRTRALAALSVVLALPVGSTTLHMVAMTPPQVRELQMPLLARNWVRRWLQLHRAVYGRAADHTGWLGFGPLSNGRPRMVGHAVSTTLFRSGAPAWRWRELLKARWPAEWCVGWRSFTG